MKVSTLAAQFSHFRICVHLRFKKYYLAQTVTISSGKQTNRYINEHDGENISL